MKGVKNLLRRHYNIINFQEMSDVVQKEEPLMTKPKKDRRLHLSTPLTVLGCIAASLVVLLFSYAYYVGVREKLIETNASTDVFRNMNVELLDGTTFSSEQLKRSKLTVLNVWETTCPSCIGEFPALEEISNELNPNEIQIIGLCHDLLDSDGTLRASYVETAKAIISDTGVTYPQLIPDYDMYQYLRSVLAGYPTTYFLTSEGEILESIAGSNNKEGWLEKLNDVYSRYEACNNE